ncbi:MAG: Peptidyl-prolyl cis-trans isomerase [Thermodesulfobacteriota bacterium]|nr:Peptidyl-prolyl cis-trans isomerase [Thermodesulfobacteriota bacterium]
MLKRRLPLCHGNKPKWAGLKNQRWVLLVCLIAVMFVARGTYRGAHAQTQPDLTPQFEQGGQITPDKPDEAPILKTQKDQVNYAIGVQLIGNLKRQRVDIDLDLIMKGMQDAFSGEKLLMSDAEVRKAFMIYQDEVRRSQATLRNASLEENKKKGDAFLAENKKKDGVITLPSGLQYRVINTGDGKKPTDTDSVECHYRGTLITGEEFDSSYRRGRPLTFKVNSVVPGWSEALKLMPVGSQWQIIIPSQLAYGERGVGNFIKPGETLIFEVELLAIR